jgi:hypothetical protein
VFGFIVRGIRVRESRFEDIKPLLSNNDHDLTVQPTVKYEIRMLHRVALVALSLIL